MHGDAPLGIQGQWNVAAETWSADGGETPLTKGDPVGVAVTPQVDRARTATRALLP
jgi:hypothetical protein